jgi:uncharacterized integral membrane protein
VAIDPKQLEEGSAERKGTRTWRSRTVAAAILGGLAAVFAVLNRDDVEVNWILGTWSTPLIIVIAVSFLAGVAADRLAVVRRAKRRSAP